MLTSAFRKLASNFLADEDGAVTVDWVMLTAGIVLLGVMVVSGIKVAVGVAATDVGAVIESASNALT